MKNKTTLVSVFLFVFLTALISVMAIRTLKEKQENAPTHPIWENIPACTLCDKIQPDKSKVIDFPTSDGKYSILKEGVQYSIFWCFYCEKKYYIKVMTVDSQEEKMVQVIDTKQ